MNDNIQLPDFTHTNKHTQTQACFPLQISQTTEQNKKDRLPKSTCEVKNAGFRAHGEIHDFSDLKHPEDEEFDCVK